MPRVLSSITVVICNYAPSGRMSRCVHHRRLSFPAQQGMICRGYAGAVKGSALGTHIKLENNTIEGMNTGCLFLTNRLPHAVDVLMPLCVERLELPKYRWYCELKTQLPVRICFFLSSCYVLLPSCFPQPFGEYARQLKSLL